MSDTNRKEPHRTDVGKSPFSTLRALQIWFNLLTIIKGPFWQDYYYEIHLGSSDGMRIEDLPRAKEGWLPKIFHRLPEAKYRQSTLILSNYLNWRVNRLVGDTEPFSTLAENFGYWKVEIYEQDCNKTKFSSHYGLFSFIRMKCGIKNAPGTFQNVIEVIL